MSFKNKNRMSFFQSFSASDIRFDKKKTAKQLKVCNSLSNSFSKLLKIGKLFHKNFTNL